ncbi:MAG: hypothetical protein ACJ741_04185 [Pyrinomonadaceae bacterium]
MSKNDDTPTLEEQFYRLDAFFQLSAQAVVEAQALLDTRLNRAYLSACEVGGHARLYSIPRAVIDFRFGLNIDHQKKLLMLIPKGGGSLEQNTHQLIFSVDATPEPPPAIRLDDASGGDAPQPFQVREPYFLLPADEEAAVCRQLIVALGGGLTGGWISAVPDSSAHGGVKYLSQSFVDNEIINIVKALKPENKKGERGMVFFRYEGMPATYLIVRVVGKDANDSVFTLTTGARPEAVIYSIDGDDTKQISYKPLHHLIHTVRRWLQGELPSSYVPHPEGIPFQYGLQYLQPFAEHMRTGYVNGLKYLSALGVTEQTGVALNAQIDAPPVYYDLADVRAKLTYSLEFGSKDKTVAASAGAADDAISFNFDSQGAGNTLSAGQDDDSGLIGSRVVLRARREGDRPLVEIELSTPEFALSGVALKKFIGVATEAENVARVVAAFDDDERYGEFLNNEEFRSGVVTLLSYRGATAKEEFLVVWPGTYEDASRDFAFTCKLDGELLREINVVMRVEEQLEDVPVGIDNDDVPGTGITAAQYRVFHNFFHAVRIWRARITSP